MTALKSIQKMRHSFFWGGAVYQVTSDMVSDDELGSYIDILAESVTFDTETKIPFVKRRFKQD